MFPTKVENLPGHEWNTQTVFFMSQLFWKRNLKFLLEGKRFLLTQKKGGREGKGTNINKKIVRDIKLESWETGLAYERIYQMCTQET